MQFNFTIWVCFRKNSTIIYELWFFFKIIAFLRVYFNFFINFKFIISACILQFNNVMYDKIFTSITTAFIKFNKNFKQRISYYDFDLSKVQRQCIFCYDLDFSKVQRQRIFCYDFDFSKVQRQCIFCYDFNFLKAQRQRIFYYNFDFLKAQRQRIFLMIRFSIHNFLTLSDLIIYLLIFVLYMLINSRTHVTQLKMQFYSSTYLFWQFLDNFMYISLLTLNKFEL